MSTGLLSALENNAPIHDDHVMNNAGGYVYEASQWDILDRFLILGSENDSFYVSSQVLTFENTKNLLKCIETDGLRVVNKIVQISDSGRALKNDSAIYALAMCVGFGNPTVKKEALNKMRMVVRTGTHLFFFVETLQKIKEYLADNPDIEHSFGWGRSLRKAISSWYTSKALDELVYQLIKYKHRQNWRHYDVFNLAHPKPKIDTHKYIFQTIVKGFSDKDLNLDNNFSAPIRKIMEKYIIGSNITHFVGDDVDKMIALIRKYNLPREVIPTKMLKNPEIWEAMLQIGMPVMAMIRNIRNMRNVGLLTPRSVSESIVVGTLSDTDKLKAARIHPMHLLLAYYQNRDYGVMSNRIKNGLIDAFNKSFEFVETTNKRYMMALDVSGSMSCGFNCAGGGNFRISSSEAMAAVFYSICRAEKNSLFGVFDDEFTIVDFDFNKSYEEFVTYTRNYYRFGDTDITQTIQYLMDNNIAVDTIVVGSDGESWCEDSPFDVMIQKYRDKIGIPVKCVFADTVANDWSICSLHDPYSINVVGFDASLPRLIQEFTMIGE